MSTNKPHKGILKRMRITGTGKVKHKSSNSKHLKSNKSGKRLRKLRKDRFLWSSQTEGIALLLFRRLRGKDQPRSAQRRSPSPAAKKALRAAAAEAALANATATAAGTAVATKPVAGRSGAVKSAAA